MKNNYELGKPMIENEIILCGQIQPRDQLPEKTMSLNCQEYAKFIKKWSRKNETTPHRKTRGSNINQAISMNTVFSFENYVFSFENYYINLCIFIYCFV